MLSSKNAHMQRHRRRRQSRHGRANRLSVSSSIPRRPARSLTRPPALPRPARVCPPPGTLASPPSCGPACPTSSASLASPTSTAVSIISLALILRENSVGGPGLLVQTVERLACGCFCRSVTSAPRWRARRRSVPGLGRGGSGRGRCRSVAGGFRRVGGCVRTRRGARRRLARRR